MCSLFYSPIFVYELEQGKKAENGTTQVKNKYLKMNYNTGQTQGTFKYSIEDWECSTTTFTEVRYLNTSLTTAVMSWDMSEKKQKNEIEWQDVNK